MSPFQQSKIWAMQALGLHKDALHIYIGMTVFLVAAGLLRWPLSSWKPLGAVLVAALIGESWDIIDSLSMGAEPLWSRGWHDVWTICFWPSVLFLLARYTRLLRP